MKRKILSAIILFVVSFLTAYLLGQSDLSDFLIVTLTSIIIFISIEIFNLINSYEN